MLSDLWEDLVDMLAVSFISADVDTWRHNLVAIIKGKPDREIIFANIHENGVCKISITTIPFVI